MSLSWQLAKANLKLRNEGSFLGNIWYLLNPFLLFWLLFLVFFDRLGANIPSYPAYLLVGILLYNYFLRITSEAAGLISGSSFIKSIAFPRHVLVFALVLEYFVSHLLEIVVFFAVLFFLGVPFHGMVLYVVILVMLSAFIFGVALFLSAMGTYAIDLHNLWSFATLLLWFATPIFYDIGGQVRLFIFNLFNPMYYFITAARDLVVYAQLPAWWIMTGMLLYTLVALVGGWFVFRRLQSRFAEVV